MPCNGFPNLPLASGLGLNAVAMEPVAQRIGARIHLEWDVGMFPKVLVQDPATGKFLAITPSN